MLLLAVLVIGLTALGVSYWGAGRIISPPKMSPMGVYPEKFGLAYEKVSFRSEDGHHLAGWLVPSPSGIDTTILICHSWGGNKSEISERALILNRELGADLFYFDFRGHGESGPSVVMMGKLKLRDFRAAIDGLKEHQAGRCRRLAVFDLSMGASSVVALGLAGLPGAAAAVLESPFRNYHLVGGRWAWNQFRVPFSPMVLLCAFFTEHLARAPFPANP